MRKVKVTTMNGYEGENKVNAWFHEWHNNHSFTFGLSAVVELCDGPEKGSVLIIPFKDVCFGDEFTEVNDAEPTISNLEKDRATIFIKLNETCNELDTWKKAHAGLKAIYDDELKCNRELCEANKDVDRARLMWKSQAEGLREDRDQLEGEVIHLCTLRDYADSKMQRQDKKIVELEKKVKNGEEVERFLWRKLGAVQKEFALLKEEKSLTKSCVDEEERTG